MANFDILPIVLDVGESFTVSGIASTTFNDRGDPTYTYTAYSLSGVVQVMVGDEEEVKEGILNKEDIVIFVDQDETNASSALKKENFVTISTTTSGIFRMISVIHEAGHYEVMAKRIQDTA